MEIWKKIPGLPDAYEASSLGRIRRLASTYTTDFREVKVTRRINAKTYRINKLTSKGYWRLRILDKTYYSHQLIARAFIPNPNNLPQINHKNCIKTDNRPENLEWVSNKENREHAILNNLVARGAKIHKKLTDQCVKSIRFLADRGVCQGAIANIFNVSDTTIGSIYLRKSWKHITE